MSKIDKTNNNEMTRRVVDATKVKKLVAGTLITATLMGSTTGVFADSRYENLDYLGEGYISVAEEVGPQGNGGFISSGVGDAGGISYGVLQLTSKAGGASANKFAFTYLKNNHPEYYKFFEGVDKAGTKSFSDAWTKAYNHNPGEFEKIQLDYKDITYVKPAVQMVKDAYGIDLLSSRARTEWVHATSVQFGPGGVKQVVGKAGVNNDMDDVELISKLSQEKRDSVGTYKFLGCSQSVRNSVFNRFNREEKEMIKIAKEEAGDSLEDVLNKEAKKDEEVVTVIETDDVVLDVTDDKTDTSDEKVEDSEKEDTTEDESIVDDSKDEDSSEDDKTTDGDEPDSDEMEDESIIDDEEVDKDENIDEDDSIVDNEEVDNNENVDEDDSIIDDEKSDTDNVDTDKNTGEDDSIVDEEVDVEEDVENVEEDNSVVDDSVIDDEESNSNDTTDEDNSTESEDTENKTESEDKENSEVEKEESTENETMEDSSIIDDSNIEDTNTETDTSDEKTEDTSDTVENDKSDQSNEDTGNTNIEEDKSEEVKEDTNSDNNKVEDVEKEDVNTEDSNSENKTDIEEDKSEKVDVEEDKVQTEQEVETDKEVEDTKTEDTQDEVKEGTQDEAKEEAQNDNNEQQDTQADVKAEPTQTEQVVAMSDSEARIQELQAKLEGNLFQNMFSKLSV